jgi:transcriptional regulator with XRE-family HTH domain
MNALQFGFVVRTLRIRAGLRQLDLERVSGVPRWLISLLERGHARRLTVESIEAILAGIGAKLDMRILWNGPELDKLLDAAHAALQAALKEQLERWGWLVRVEVSYSRFGERGRIDLLAFHPATRTLLVIEVKTALIDVQALLGSLDVKARLAREIVERFGWQPAAVVPCIVFAEDRTTRRRLEQLNTLFDRFSLRGRSSLSWLRQPGASHGGPVPSGLLWLTSVASDGGYQLTGRQRAAGKAKRVRRPRRP